MNEFQDQAGVSGWYDEDDIYHEINDSDSYQDYLEWESSL